ncbi:transcription factor MafA-like isoform X1 [Cynara cardunculus var. scolymus]|uniref:transcription factor MafA-like isoform X1 n=1 Tax=Cynara cardunculus var. scolymus TaxID=59895 RepID=UPI000D62B843|nr:transcription factor MafA-like isoform X1 [Cynara cardunculus var. scolymus]
MASILKGGGVLLALALITIIILGSFSHTIPLVDAQTPAATDCNSAVQSEIPGCGDGGGGGGSGGSSRTEGSGPTPAGASSCRGGCCGQNKFGDCICCE